VRHDCTDRNFSRHALFADRNVRWLCAGSAVSMLGDQFTLIALPWLVLQLTGDPLALGGVLAVTSLPRAVFLLVGGALVDRRSPRDVLLGAKLANAVLLGALALLTATGALQLWMVFALAAAIGVVTAFSYPAGNSLLPQAVPPALLTTANATFMAMQQLSVLAGPVVAGGLIAWFGRGTAVAHAGLAGAFAFDAASFVWSAWALTRVVLRARIAPAATSSLRASIVEAAQAFWRDGALRTLCLYFAAIGFFVGGPIQVALPVLAHDRLAGGAASLGALMASHGAGVLGGMAIAGLRPGWRLRTLGTTMLAIDAVAGLTFMPFGHITSTWQGMAMLAMLGALGGFVQVAVLTWMQQRVAPAMLGRTMSLFMFIFLGLAPLASALAGALLRVWSPATLFAASGGALLAIVAVGAVATPIRRIVDSGG
jgi:hypothetical protein